MVSTVDTWSRVGVGAVKEGFLGEVFCELRLERKVEVRQGKKSEKNVPGSESSLSLMTS